MNKDKICKGGVAGDCNRPHYAKGFCSAHFQAFHKGLPTDYEVAEKVRPNTVTKCSVEGCEAPHRSKGLCQNHYSNFRYHERKKTGA